MDPIEELQSKLRRSPEPVSCFFLVKSPRDADRALDKLRLLTERGVSRDYIATLTHFLTEVVVNESADRDFQRSLLFFFRPGDASVSFPGVLQLRNVIGQGIEIELIMPGAIASSLPQLFDNGFWTAHMPPSFYD